MSDEAAIVLTQTEQAQSETTAPGAVDNPEVVTEQQESTDAETTVTADEDSSGNVEQTVTADSTVESNDQTTSSEVYADFKLPEGMELDAQLLEQATPLFTELGLNQEQAQKLVDFQASQVQANQQGQAEAFNKLKQDWQDQAKSDKEIGGDKFEQSVSDAREALTKFGTPELTKLLNDFGIGNNPEIIRFMAKVGRLTKEDVPGTTGAPSTPEKDRLSILYPSESN